MAKIDTKITRVSYMLKRLRDSGYRADKLIGPSDPVSSNKDLDKLLDKLFPPKRYFSQEEVKSTLKKFKTEILRSYYIPQSYDQADSRVWTILIDGGRSNVYLTFYKNSKDTNEKYEEQGSDYFEIYDGGQYVKPLRRRVNTQSFEVIAQTLNEMGVVLKYSH